MTDSELVQKVITMSGLSSVKFAALVIGRTDRQVRRWLEGQPLPADLRSWLEGVERITWNEKRLFITVRNG